MGKKGSWISALKKAFSTNPKEKPTNVQLVAQYQPPAPAPPEQQHRSARDKKRWGFGRSRQLAEPAAAAAAGAPLINIPLYRQPSSIEKILGDADMEQQSRQYSYGRPRPPAQYQITAAAKPTTTVAAAAASTAPPKPKPQPRERGRDGDKHAVVVPVPPPPPSPPPLIRRFDHDREQQQRLHQSRAATERRQLPRRPPAAPSRTTRPAAASAAARQSQRSGPPADRARAAAVAIQAAFRGYMGRRNYRSLRGLIRLQGVVRGASIRRQTAHAMRCMQTLVRVQAQVRASRVEAMERRHGRRCGAMLRDGWRRDVSQNGGGMWDESLLSRDEADARTKRKVEAVVRRERTLAYAYSHQLLKATPMAAHAILADLQSGRSPWWWSPMERRHHEPEASSFPPRHVEPMSRPLPAPVFAHREPAAAATPARSVASAYAKPCGRPARPARVGGIRDDESLTSCPAFGVPNYMTPTMSASAKARARAQLVEEQLHREQQAAEQKPRFSFGLGQSIGSWAKSPFMGKRQPSPSTASSRVGTPAASVAAGGGGRHRPTRSIGGLSVDSTASMPAGLSRRPFK